MYRLVILIIVIITGFFVYPSIQRALKELDMRQKIRRSFTLQLVFLTIVFFSFIIVFMHDNNYIYTRDKMRAVAESKVVNIDNIIHHAGEDITMLAAGNAYMDFFNTEIDFSTRYNQVKRRIDSTITSHDDFTSIKLISKDGYVVASNSEDEGKYMGDQEIFLKGLEGLFYGNPHICESTGCKVMSITSPVIVDNKVEGVVLVNYDVAGIEFITNQTGGLGEKGEIFLFTEDNYAITNLKKIDDNDIIPLGDDFCSDCKQLADNDEDVFIDTLDYSGDRSVASVVKLETLDWYLLIQMDYMEMLYPILLVVLLGLMVLFFIILIGSYGARRIADRISSPIESLTENVNLVIAGDLKRSVSIDSPGEIGILSQDIDKMTKVILKSQKETDKLIFEQTKSLNIQKEKMRKQQLALLNILEDVGLEKEEISSQKNKLDIILEGIGDGVFAVDQDYVITRFNKVASEISGYSAAEAIGMKCKDILEFRKEKDDSLYYDFITKAMTAGEIQTMANHTYIVKKDGSHIPVADSAAPIKNEKGKIMGCVVVFRDVTKEREINDMKDEFVSVASHQLRTPLTGIKWFIQLLTKEDQGKLNTTQRDYLKNMYDSNERMIKLVDDLLSVSRIDTGKKFEVKKKKVNIIPVFKEVLKMQSVIARRRGIELICQKSCPTKIVVNADADKLSEVFANIVSNAIKYSKDKGKVKITVKEEKDAYIFVVKDNGLGIPKNQQEHIFDKFFRAENVKKHEVGGNGLGLYIARSIMRAHKGDIWFESKENKGTTFYISVPK